MRTDKANHRLHLKWRDLICFLWKVAFPTLQESCRTGFPPHVHICSQVICPSFVGLSLPLVPRERLQSRKFLQQTRVLLREADALKPKASMLQGQTVFGCWNLNNSTLAYIAGETRPAYGPSRVMVSDFMTCRIPSSTYLVRVRWQPTLYYHTTMI